MTEAEADQTAVFASDEGDNWFRRNRASLDHERSGDQSADMLARWCERHQVRSVCELGCSNGWRLGAIAQSMPSIARLSGSDPSRKAVEDGRRRWPELELAVGSLDRPGLAGSFDVVIVSFVFHWVARKRLAGSVAAVDALLRDGGALIIADFLPDRPCARRYHHREDIEMYTYKQDYTRCFTALGTYSEEQREVFAHSGGSGTVIDPQERAMCALLSKDLDSYERA